MMQHKVMVIVPFPWAVIKNEYIKMHNQIKKMSGRRIASENKIANQPNKQNTWDIPMVCEWDEIKQ